ncbi:extracellular solute-binding protein [Halocatena salina]|uniref:Extracellular solute-binding protein n=1 Tax=Halocatena salina TaxID=2934340 RepID=A0A8U0A1L6_9EURY|nr:extracellular solute-binding protein [Halocatena salina]UPM42964.1 extracellular solute-binding protein [Halocatena salina]
MTKQRSRRAVIQAFGTGVFGLSGCLGKGWIPTGDRHTSPVTILAAGSLTNALSNGLAPELDTPVQIETHGSARIARMVKEGIRDPDIVVVADTALFNAPLNPSWYSVFTSNAVVIASNTATEDGKRVGRTSQAWYELVADDDINLGRTDPKADPLGYRTLFVIDLAARYYEVDGLASTILADEQIYPESSLMTRFETGAVDVAIAYRNMAVERGYDYIDLPDPIDLSAPEYTEDWYSTVTYTLPDGTAVQGGTISYGAAARTMTDDVLSVFDRLVRGSYLQRHGFILHESFPNHHGRVPERIENNSGTPADRSTAEQSVIPISV